MTLKSQSPEAQREKADLLESDRVKNLWKYKSDLFALRKAESDKLHEEAINRLRKSTDAMTSISAILLEMQRRGFQFKAGEVENAIKEDVETLKFIADTRAGKFISESDRQF